MRTSRTAPRSLTRPARAPHVPHAPRIPPMAVVKMFLLASVSIVASVWALARYYARRAAPHVDPAAVVVDAGGAAEIAAPDLEVLPPAASSPP